MFSIIISLLSFFTNTQFVFALVCWIQSENAVDLNVLENSTWKIFCNFILVNFNNNNNTFTTTGIKKIIVFFFLDSHKVWQSNKQLVLSLPSGCDANRWSDYKSLKLKAPWELNACMLK